MRQNKIYNDISFTQPSIRAYWSTYDELDFVKNIPNIAKSIQLRHGGSLDIGKYFRGYLIGLNKRRLGFEKVDMPRVRSLAEKLLQQFN